MSKFNAKLVGNHLSVNGERWRFASVTDAQTAYALVLRIEEAMEKISQPRLFVKHESAPPTLTATGRKVRGLGDWKLPPNVQPTEEPWEYPSQLPLAPFTGYKAKIRLEEPTAPLCPNCERKCAPEHMGPVRDLKRACRCWWCEHSWTEEA